jgi:hypothetical protein
MTDTNSYSSLTCPLPECSEALYVHFESTQPLYVGTLDDREPLEAGDGDVSTWSVECINGHVVLVPGDPYCTVCEDDCVHDVDHSDETRTFRASDIDRLRALIKQLSGDEQA